jgi:hypothetical protein
MWYAEHFATRYDAVDRTFCDAIKFLILLFQQVSNASMPFRVMNF